MDKARTRPRSVMLGELKKPKALSPVISSGKIGRNDLCPCGSGRKYKSCHKVVRDAQNP